MLRCDKQNTLGICKFNEFQVTVAQNAHGHKQRTLEPPALRCRTVAGTTYFGAFYAAAASGR